MKKVIFIFIFIWFLVFYSNSTFAQAAINTEEITVLKKANPNSRKENSKTQNTIITSEKMENPSKKKDEEVEEKTMIVTEKKSKNPNSPK